MRINEALKRERLAQHKTQSQWIRDINVSLSHYSEIESGYSRNGKSSDIDSEVLIKLLKSNNVNITNFFESVADAYEADENMQKIEKIHAGFEKCL